MVNKRTVLRMESFVSQARSVSPMSSVSGDVHNLYKRQEAAPVSIPQQPLFILCI